MKIDMNARAISLRLRQVEQLRRICLSLAASAPGRVIQSKHGSNGVVRRTYRALGRRRL